MPDFSLPVPATALSSPRPLIALFDPTPGRNATANTLAETGWEVLVVNSADPEALAQALDLICLLPEGPGHGILTPLALILEAFHPVGLSQQEQTLTSPLPATDLIRHLSLRGFFSNITETLPPDQPTTLLILYTADPATLAEAAPFRAQIPRTGQGEELLPLLSELTGINFCAGCRSPLYPQDKALLLTPALYCPTCAKEVSATERRERTALFPARLLARANHIFTAEHPPLPNLPLTADLWDM